MVNRKEQFEFQFLSFLKSFNLGADKVVAHFAEDAIIEYPYSPVPAKMNVGEYQAQLAGMLINMRDFSFTGYKIYATDEDGTYWVPVDAKCFILSTSKTFEQNYVMRITVDEAFKITRYSEYWNPLLSKKAFTKDEI